MQIFTEVLVWGFVILMVLVIIYVQFGRKSTRPHYRIPKNRVIVWRRDPRGIRVKTTTDPDGTRQIMTFPPNYRDSKGRDHSHLVIVNGKEVYHRNEEGVEVVKKNRDNPGGESR